MCTALVRHIRGPATKPLTSSAIATAFDTSLAPIGATGAAQRQTARWPLAGPTKGWLAGRPRCSGRKPSTGGRAAKLARRQLSRAHHEAATAPGLGWAMAQANGRLARVASAATQRHKHQPDHVSQCEPGRFARTAHDRWRAGSGATKPAGAGARMAGGQQQIIELAGSRVAPNYVHASWRVVAWLLGSELVVWCGRANGPHTRARPLCGSGGHDQ